MKRTPIQRRTPLRSSIAHAAARTLATPVQPPRRPRDTGPTDRVKSAVRLRSGDQCELCRAHATNYHHRRARGSGGSSDPVTNSAANLLHLCGSGVTGCHGHIESERAEAYRLGHLVRRAHDPRRVPAFLLAHGWVLLSDDGSTIPTPERITS